MVQTYQPPVMAVTEQTLPELQPIFTLLNSHSNKLYQEGYFLKLDDQDIRRRPCSASCTIGVADFCLVQEESRTPTGRGPSALLNWSAPCCRSGMPPN